MSAARHHHAGIRMKSLLSSLHGIALMVRRSIRHHALSSIITAASLALASGLVMATFTVYRQAHQAFTAGGAGFDAVLGARGSQVQLVLNAVFHLDVSPGNIPWSLYQAIKARPEVEVAIPYALGDNYYSFRIIGTTLDLFQRFRLPDGEPLSFQQGEIFDVARREAVVGHIAAQRTGLRPGDVFQPYHGLTFDPTHQHAEEYVVIGILKPTNTPLDRVIFIPIEGVFRMEGHVLRASGETFVPEAGREIPDEHKEVSAVLLKLSDPQAGFTLSQMVNRQGNVATLAWPVGTVMADLFERFGWGIELLKAIAWLVVLVAITSGMASLYNTMDGRRRDMAIMRALGARRRTLVTAIVAEATTIATLGAIAGFAVYATILSTAAILIQQNIGVVINLYAPHPVLILTPLSVIALGSFSGLLPAVQAYRTDPVSNL